LVIEVNKNTRTNSLAWIAGSWINSATEDWAAYAEKPYIDQSESGITRHPICSIYRVSSDANAIVSIENEIGVDVYSPLVKPPTEYLSSEDILNTWNSAFNQWNQDKQAAFIAWMAEQQQNFITWWNGLRLVMDENVAGHLQNEIEDLNSRLTELSVVDQTSTLSDGTIKKVKYLSANGIDPMTNGVLPRTTSYTKTFTLTSGEYNYVYITDADSFNANTSVEVYTDKGDLPYSTITIDTSLHRCAIGFYGKYTTDQTVTVTLYVNE
jgi:hypothetical protein